MRTFNLAAIASILVGTAGLISSSGSLAAQSAMPNMPNMAPSTYPPLHMERITHVYFWVS